VFHQRCWRARPGLAGQEFEDIFDVTSQLRLEEELDEIEKQLPWREAFNEFWKKFVIDPR